MKKPKECRDINEIRENIDEIDHKIMKLCRKRSAYVKEIVKFKTDEVSVIAEIRQKDMIAQRRLWAIDLGLDPNLFEDIFWTLIRFNVQKELEILKDNTSI